MVATKIKSNSQNGGYKKLWILFAAAIALTGALSGVSIWLWAGTQEEEPRSFDDIIASLGDTFGGSTGMDIPAIVDEFLTPEFMGNLTANLMEGIEPDTRQELIGVVVDVAGQLGSHMSNETMEALASDAGVVLAEMLNDAKDTSGQTGADSLHYLQYPINGFADGFNTSDTANQMVANAVYLMTNQMPSPELAGVVSSLLQILVPVLSPTVTLYADDSASVDKLLGDVGMGVGMWASEHLNALNETEAEEAVRSAYDVVADPMWAFYDSLNLTDTTLNNLGMAIGNMSYDAFASITSESGAASMINSDWFLNGLSEGLYPNWMNTTIAPMAYLRAVNQDDLNLIMHRGFDDIIMETIAYIVPEMLMGTGGLATAGKALQSLKWMVVNQTMEQRNGWDVLGDMLGTAYDNAEQQIADEQATATDNGTTTVGRRGLLEDVADALGSCASLSLNTISSEEMVSSYWSVYEMADKFLWGVWDGMSLTSQSQHSVGLSLGKILGESAGAVNLTTAVPTMLRAKYFVPGLADGMAATNNTFNDVARLVVAFLDNATESQVTTVLDAAINNLLMDFANIMIPEIETDTVTWNKTNDAMQFMAYSMSATQKGRGWNLLKPTLLAARSNADVYLEENKLPPYDQE